MTDKNDNIRSQIKGPVRVNLSNDYLKATTIEEATGVTLLVVPVTIVESAQKPLAEYVVDLINQDLFASPVHKENVQVLRELFKAIKADPKLGEKLKRLEEDSSTFRAPTICVNYMDFDLQVYRVFPTNDYQFTDACASITKALDELQSRYPAEIKDEQVLMGYTRFALNDYIYESLPEILPVRQNPGDGIDFQSRYTDCTCDFYIEFQDLRTIYTEFNKPYNDIFYGNDEGEGVQF